MKVKVEIVRRPEIADPEGVTVRNALHDLGYDEVADVRFQRVVSLELNVSSRESAAARVEEMCRRLLANPVLEDFRVVVEE